MNRRAFSTTLITSSALGLLGGGGLQHGAAQDPPLTVATRWGAARDSGAEIDRFTTSITAYGSEEDAREAFDTLRDAVKEGTLYAEETGAKLVGDDGFAIRYDDPNFVIDEFVMRFGPLIYQFRSEAIHYGGARNAYRLMEEVVGRVDTSASTEDALTALLPTAEEVDPYGPTEQEGIEATPAARLRTTARSGDWVG